MKKIFANYLEHLKRTMEDRSTNKKQSSVEDALQDFAERTGLSEMQKRALRRQIFVKQAMDFVVPEVKKDKERVDSGDAPPSILPGIKPGDKTDKILQKKKKKPSNLTRRDDSLTYDKTEFDAKDMGGLEEASSRRQNVYARTSLRDKIVTLQQELVSDYMTPDGTLKNPDWDPEASWEARVELESEINSLLYDYQDAVEQQRDKEEKKSPKGRARKNNVKFLEHFDTALKVKNAEERVQALGRLNERGIQHAFDTALSSFEKEKYYKKSQGYDKSRGDYVRCMICEWINPNNPSILPVEHLKSHDELSTQDIVQAYLKLYPEGAMQSREQELAAFTDRVMRTALHARPTEAPTIIIDQVLNYTDEVMLEIVKHHLARLQVAPYEVNMGDLANQIIEDVKSDLNEEYPGQSFDQVGELDQKEVTSEDFHKILITNIKDAAREYDGLIVRRRAVQPERKIETKEELPKFQYENPTEEEIKENSLVPITLSVDANACWNCGQNHLIHVKNIQKDIVSVTCPTCESYRELAVTWNCPSCDDEKFYVIRDPNENDSGGTKKYTIFCDQSKINGGENAVGNSKLVHIRGQVQQRVTTELESFEATSSETFDERLQVADSVASDQYGFGKVVMLGEGNQIFVDFPENPKTTEIEQSEGEVIFLQTSRQGYSGHYEVTDIVFEEDKIIIKMRNEKGMMFSKELSSSQGKQEIPIATEVARDSLKKSDLDKKRIRRCALLKRCGVECQGQEVVEITRREDPVLTYAEMTKKLIRRAKITKYLRRRS